MAGKHRFSALLLAGALAAGACSADTATDRQDDRALRVFSNYRGTDADAFRRVLERFTEETGIATSYVGTAAFAARIRDRVRAGDPPDVALFPQPAILAEMARAGFLVPLDADLVTAVREHYSGAAMDLTTIDGAVYGAWYRLSVKSLVWYPPRMFAAQGYEIPATWEDLLALTEQMESDGFTPWCLGMEAFDASGWTGTDWIEDLVLRLHGPEVYDRWTAGTIPFTDPQIRSAFEEFGRIALQPGRVTGGTRSILTVPALQAIGPMFEDPPGCLLTRQGSFQAAELPSGTTVGPQGEVDVFVLPAIGDEPAPLLTSGEIAAAFSPSAEASALIAYLADARSGEPWAAVGGYNSPHLGFDQTAYGNDFERRLGDLVSEAEVVRFDGSDLMPPAVGTGTFWTGMIDYVAGSDLESVLEGIQAGYESSSP